MHPWQLHSGRAFHMIVSWFIVSFALSVANAQTAQEQPRFAKGLIPEAPALAIPNAHIPFRGILTGGQPTPAQLEEAKSLGYKTVINLRPPQEEKEFDEAAAIKELGLRYVSIPVAGAADIRPGKAQELVAALADPSHYPVLIHCKSGNRVGALFALDAGISGNASVDEAIEIGRKAGLTQLEETVRERLQER